MSTKNLVLFLFFLLAGFTCFAQDKLILENSKEITNIKIVDITANTIRYQKFGNENSKVKGIFRERVFAITYSDGKEKIIYLPDPNDGDFTIEQERMFIKGMKDSREHYHNIPSYLVGFAFGIAGPVAVSTAGVFPSFIALPPAIGVFLMGLSSPNMNHQKNIEKKYLNNEEYSMGFQKKARSKKVRNAFLSSIVGVAAGLVISNNVKL